MIMTRAFCTAAVHRRAHEFHGLGQPLEHRFADQEMADIEFDDLRQRRDRLRGGIIEPVAGMHFKAEVLAPVWRRHGCSCHSASASSRVALAERIAPGAGVELDHRRAELGRRLDLCRLRRDEQRNPDAGIA